MNRPTAQQIPGKERILASGRTFFRADDAIPQIRTSVVFRAEDLGLPSG